MLARPAGSVGPVRVLLADDHVLLRQGLRALLEQHDVAVVGEASDGQEGVAAYRRLRPDVLVLDLRMPGLDGLGALAAIRAEFPDARVIVLTTYDGDEDIYRSLRAGAMGYVLKDAPLELLLQAIHAVCAGQRWVAPAAGAQLATRIGADALTERELAVLQEMATGKSNQEIAAALMISEGTVKFHVNRILNKLDVADRTQAVLTALRRGLAHLIEGVHAHSGHLHRVAADLAHWWVVALGVDGPAVFVAYAVPCSGLGRSRSNLAAAVSLPAWRFLKNVPPTGSRYNGE